MNELKIRGIKRIEIISGNLQVETKVMAEQVDNITCAINNYWSRYSNLLYQAAFQDVISLLTEN